MKSRKLNHARQMTKKNKKSGETIRSRRTKKLVGRALTKMRKTRFSLRRASSAIGISPKTVLRHGAPALEKKPSGRYAAKSSDKLSRDLRMPTPEGMREITVRNSRDASTLGGYWSALHTYYESGDTSGLQKFTGRSITDTSGRKFPLLTDLTILDRLGSAGVLSFESLYAE
jgi:hypothetical protein